ncbi:hypothetical protein BH18ACT5_BH18ACT5_01200 [soil metagenome]
MNEGLVVIIGSGELGPSMKSTYRHLLEHVNATEITILDSTYGFQENADHLTERIEQHFRDAFSVDTKVASLRRPDADQSDRDRFIAAVEQAQVVFAGPGSPSYANRIWSQLPLRATLTAVVDRGGAVVMASAAAVTLGAQAIPVYEIYKVGDDPKWLPGFDLLSNYGLSVAVVPHWNNREGGFHDTSHCFIGATRFRQLVDQLSPEISLLGVDEHTSVSVHSQSGVMLVLGSGASHFNDQTFDTSMPVPGFVARPQLEAALPPPEQESEWRGVIALLVELREEARARGDFARSDSIRDRLSEVGVMIRDTPTGTEWSANHDR